MLVFVARGVELIEVAKKLCFEKKLKTFNEELVLSKFVNVHREPKNIGSYLTLRQLKSYGWIIAQEAPFYN